MKEEEGKRRGSDLKWTGLKALAVGGGTAFFIALFTFLITPGFFQGLEYQLYNMRVRLATGQAEEIDPDIEGLVLIRIDDRSLKNLGRFEQWPREYHSRLATQLAEWGAEAIFFDITFFQDDRDPEVDRELAKGFGDAGVVYSAISLIDSANFVYLSTVDEQEVIDNAPRSVIPVDRLEGAEKLPDRSRAGAGSGGKLLQGPAPELLRASLGVGLVNIDPDEDGVVRRQPLLWRTQDHVVPTAALRLFLDLVRIDVGEIRFEPGEALHVGAYSFPVDSQGRFQIYWYRDESPPYREIPYYDALIGNVPGEFFTGKVCIVGPTAAAMGDVKPTAAAPAMAGVKIHTTLLANLARGDFVTGMGSTLGIVLTVLLGAAVAFFAFRFRISIGATLTGMLFILGMVAAVYVYVQWAYWAELFRPAFGLVGAYTGAMVYRYVTEERQKMMIKVAFQQYVSPAVVDEMLADPDKLKLGGERRELTVLFADIQGFTSFSEQLDPEKLTGFLNGFLTAMTARIFEHQGTVDKYIGDCIMAIFGAPLPFDDHPAKGVNAALGMREELKMICREWSDLLPDDFDLKVGLNTGPMVVGNMGSDVRFDYTVLGDNVNLAARLEALTRQYGLSLLIPDSTRVAIGEDYLVRELDSVRVKGRNQPVIIYEVLARCGSEDDTQENRQLARCFEEALGFYRVQQWDEALEGFAGLDGDPASGVFAERCRILRAEPPGEDWDGAWTMTTK